MSDNFNFQRFRFNKYHYTDNRKGSPMNFIAVMIKGTAKIISDRKTITVNEQDVFFIPINLSYQSYWYGDDEIEFISYGFLSTQTDEPINFDLHVIECSEDVKKLILKIPIKESGLDCKTLGVFYTALSNIMPDLRKNQITSNKEKIVKRAKKYITEHLDCSVAEIAQNCYISEPYLYMIFKEEEKCTPNDYKLRVKCRKGIEYLLTTDKTVEEISSLIGFSSASHFRRVLKSQTGLTPKEMRKNSDF